MGRPSTLFLAGFLAACTGTTVNYVKPDVDEERLRADRAACESEAQRLVARDERITGDIAAGRGGNLRQGFDAFRTQATDFDEARRFRALVTECMSSLGYTIAEP